MRELYRYTVETELRILTYQYHGDESSYHVTNLFHCNKKDDWVSTDVGKSVGTEYEDIGFRDS